MDIALAAHHYAKFMDALGLERTSPDTVDTPERVARMVAELTEGLRQSAPSLRVFPEAGYNEYVIEAAISFQSLCAHHHAPFFGTVDIAYHPSGHVVGLSKLVRLVKWVAARPQLQERLTEEIAAQIVSITGCRGAYVRCQARHLCVCGRGVKDPTAYTITSKLEGKIDKAEVLSLLTLARS